MVCKMIESGKDEHAHKFPQLQMCAPVWCYTCLQLLHPPSIVLMCGGLRGSARRMADRGHDAAIMPHRPARVVEVLEVLFYLRAERRAALIFK